MAPILIRIGQFHRKPCWANMEKFKPRTPSWFGARKAAQVVAFFALQAGGVINILRSTKLVYLADRLSMDKREHSITGDNFVSMKFGPVNSNTYDLMNGRASRGLDEWAQFVAKRSNYELSIAEGVTTETLDELSRGDLRILSETWDAFNDIEKYELAEWTHRFCPEWQDPHGSSIPIDFSTVFKKLGKLHAAELAEEVQAERKLNLDLMAH